MRRLAVLALASALGAAHADEPVARQAWLRLGPPGAPVGGYFTLHNPGSQAVELVGIAAPDFERAELHETVQADGRVRMRALPRRRIEAGADFVAAPGGVHAMLFGPRHSLVPGAKTTLTLLFADGTRLTVEAEVRDARDGDDHSHHHD